MQPWCRPSPRRPAARSPWAARSGAQPDGRPACCAAHRPGLSFQIQYLPSPSVSFNFFLGRHLDRVVYNEMPLTSGKDQNQANGHVTWQSQCSRGYWYCPKGTEQTPAYAQETNMKRQTKLVGVPRRTLTASRSAPSNVKNAFISKSLISRGSSRNPKNVVCQPLHREPQKWETTIPVLKVNRKPNKIIGLPIQPPRQC